MSTARKIALVTGAIRGIGLEPLRQLAASRSTFDTNLFGVIATTQAFLPLLRKSVAGRIANVSSLLGSITEHTGPQSPIFDYKLPACNVSKRALNAWTVHLAHELRDSGIKVNAIHPGPVKTDMNANGNLSIELGAKSSVAMSLIGDIGPTGGFTHLGQTLRW